jgi:hypothetical protein
MTNLKRNLALVASAGVVAALGFGGVMSANADTGAAPSGGQEVSDGPNVGPDANANEPGHQDASNAGDAADGSTESESKADDGPNVGPDANADEPGHQDASGGGDAAD